MHYIVRNEIAYPYPNVDGCIGFFFLEEWVILRGSTEQWNGDDSH